MTLSDLASVSSLVSSIAVLFTLLFLLIQTRQNRVALERAEAIAAQTAASAFRMAIVNNKDVARVLNAGIAEEGELDQIDEIRFQTLLNEIMWFSTLIWQRQRIGLFPGDWERTQDALLGFLARRGAVWWGQNKAGFPPEFAEDVDKIIAAQQTNAST